MTAARGWETRSTEVRLAALEALRRALELADEEAAAEIAAAGGPPRPAAGTSFGPASDNAAAKCVRDSSTPGPTPGPTAYGAATAPSGVMGSGRFRSVPLAHGETLLVAHDGWGAPYAELGDEVHSENLAGPLVSLADEHGLELCAWVRPLPGSRVLGVGIDLVGLGDFTGERGAQMVPLLLSEHEIELARDGLAGSYEEGCAFAFAAKEAAFKACSAPLRARFGPDGPGEGKPFYEVREFELADGRRVRGTLRKARAQAAMDELGIAVALAAHATAGDALVCAALVLSK